MEAVTPNLINFGRQNQFNILLDEVLKQSAQPEDNLEITALLESMGWNDSRAAEILGYEDVFELANEMWKVIQKKILFARTSPVQNKSLLLHAIEIIKSFFRGIIFALPMAISVFSMLTLRFSLWSYEYLSLELATSIAIGTILSFMVIGGFTQAIARRGFSYIKQGHYNMAKRITFYFVRVGYIVCLIISLLMLVFNFIFEAFPFRMMIIVILYFFFLSTIWFSITVMYILEKEITFTGLIAIGILLVFVFFEILNFDIIVSQVIALIIVAITGLLLVIYFFRRAEDDVEKGMEKGIKPTLPRMSIVFYSVLPFFAYGLLYFTFLFADRVVAWSATNNIYMPYIIWFRGEYELGLDYALLMLIIPMGFNEVVVNQFMWHLDSGQKGYVASHTEKLAQMYLALYIKRLVLVSIIAFISSVSIYLIVKLIVNKQMIFLRPDLLASPVTNFVLIVALIAYAILVLALMNSVILFSLSQPKMVVEAVLIGLAVNIFFGFLLSRSIDYSYAIFGLLAGSVVFTVISCWKVIIVLKDLDYYLYFAS